MAKDNETVQSLRDHWEVLARSEKFWQRAGRQQSGAAGEWSASTFFDNGRREITQVMDTVHRLYPQLGADAALDFGSGVGRLTEPLSEHFTTVTGVDISAEMVRQATERLRDRAGVRFVVNTQPDLSLFEDNAFDLVNEHVVFQHMATDLTRSYLQDFHRVLRPGGVAVVTMPSLPRFTPKGIVHSAVPKPVIRQVKRRVHGVLMDMNAIRHDRMSDYLQSIGFLPPLLVPTGSAGPNWFAFRFYAQKPSS